MPHERNDEATTRNQDKRGAAVMKVEDCIIVSEGGFYHAPARSGLSLMPTARHA